MDGTPKRMEIRAFIPPGTGTSLGKAPRHVTDKRKGFCHAAPGAVFFSFLSPALSSMNTSLAFSLPSICCILRAQVEYLKATRVLAARRLRERISWNVEGDRMLGFLPAASKSPHNQKHTVKAFTILSPAAPSPPRFRLGEEKAKTFPFISFCSEVFMSISASC